MAGSLDENGLDTNRKDGDDGHIHSSISHGTGFYEIRVKGHLNSKWSDWLEGLDLKLLDNGEMILSGNIADQAALLGILNKINRLNLALLSVSEVSKKESEGEKNE